MIGRQMSAKNPEPTMPKPNWNGSITGSYGFWWWNESYREAKTGREGAWAWEDSACISPTPETRQSPKVESNTGRKKLIFMGAAIALISFLIGFYISPDGEPMPPQVEHPLPLPIRK